MSENHSTKTERWLPVVGFEGLYEVSSFGRVRGLDRMVGSRHKGTFKTWKGRILARSPHKSDGYLRVRLSRNGQNYRGSVHRLVLEAFVGSCPDGMQACHYPDRDPKNNNLENLRWDTQLANHEDSRKHGTAIRGERQGSAKMTEAVVVKIREVCHPVRGYRGELSAKNLAVAYGVSVDTILRIVHRKSWRHVP